ncbi:MULTISPECIES: ATP-binding protein [Mameliella]|uniref:ATP-binding protein n=1 Tax=Mameliella TaxID=1434019 RepID=UPI000B52DE33|nr:MULTISPECIES: ATP-binding protein [Mameliella]OWV40296.1 two-component sensor histidine kinase [Mameliella alba]OWV58848.1 two-component sensor histidine kinase [Mameliella alba]
MSRFMNSLSGQLILVVIATLFLAQVVSFFLFADERSLAIRAALGFEAAGRAANVARLIEEAPTDLKESILRAANSPLIRFDLSDAPAVEHTGHSDGGIVESRIRALMNDSYSRDIRVELHEVEGELRPLPNLSDEMTEMHMAMMRGELNAVEMNLSISIRGGEWLNVGTRFERPPLQWPFFSFVTFVISTGLLLVAVCWFVLTRLTRPLRLLSITADRLGRGEDVPELPATGSREVQELTVAFNRMQARLMRFVNDRTRMLAALGHDLRSPLTAMRVRAELVDEDDTRESLIASVEEMKGMVDATLTFAQGLTGTEETEAVDLRMFLETLRADMAVGFALSNGPELNLSLRPNAFRRALRNLIENAVRYGRDARVSWIVEGSELTLNIDDTGPGIPEGQLERVFDPFYRLEGSRSLETGGYGLGLSIARTIIQSHGGDIRLMNRTGGGLRAVITMPVAGTAGFQGEHDGIPEIRFDDSGRLAGEHGTS